MKHLKMAVAMVSFILFSSIASSCPVCYGADGTKNMGAVNASILVLMLITGAVLSMFATFIFHLRKRMKLLADNNGNQP
jgi:hypothetical protein